MAELRPHGTEAVRGAHPPQGQLGGLPAPESHRTSRCSSQRPACTAQREALPHRLALHPKAGLTAPPLGGASVFTLRPHSENFNYFEREREEGRQREEEGEKHPFVTHLLMAHWWILLCALTGDQTHNLDWDDALTAELPARAQAALPSFVAVIIALSYSLCNHHLRPVPVRMGRHELPAGPCPPTGSHIPSGGTLSS